MQRKVVSLSRDAVLWEAGDAARDIAIVAKGKLGARTGDGLVGIVLSGMVVGEAALFLDDVRAERRTATLFALEEDTEVTQYPPAVVRYAFEDGDDRIIRQVLDNVVGQICRNLLMVITARPNYVYVDAPLTALVQGIVGDLQKSRVQPLKSWDNILLTGRYLCDLRDLSDHLLSRLGPPPSERGEMIVNASQMLTQLGAGKDVLPIVDALLQAERQKAEWWARGTGA